MNFRRGERTPVSGCQIMRQSYRSDPVPVQGNEADPIEAMKHPFDLMIAAFFQRDAGVTGAVDDEGGGTRPDSFGLKLESILKFFHRFGRNRPVGFHEVVFPDFPFRIGEGFRPASVVREKDEPARTAVESTGEMQSLFVRAINEVQHGAMNRILRRAENADRFVKHEVVLCHGFLEDPVSDFDAGETRDFQPVICRSFPIDDDLSLDEAETGVALTEIESFGDEMIESHKVTK